ncbi:GNAT family N-acetyltransferase, partial [Vibrio cyclitrophicus]
MCFIFSETIVGVAMSIIVRRSEPSDAKGI